MNQNQIALTGVAIVVVAWISFMILMLSRPKGAAPKATGDKRDARSKIGIALQAIGFAFAWAPRHWEAAQWAIDHGSAAVAVWLALIAAFMFGGVLLARAGIVTLGKQWTLVAQTAEGHNLVTTGPYAYIRHPIYTAMLLTLIGTSLALTGPSRLAFALPFFALGTALRVRIEERLLAETHGDAFAAYRSRVSAVVPRIF